MANLEILAQLNAIYSFFGWLGCLVILLASSITALAYRGTEGERYSFRNHYISELGEIKVSRLAFIFNGAMVIGGIFFVLMMLGLGLRLGSAWGIAAMISGSIAGIFCALVGVFPMDNIKPHSFVAMSYFRTGLLTVFLFTITIFVQPAESRAIPLYVNIFGILALISYAVFLFVIGRAVRKNKEEVDVLDTSETKSRPKFWLLPFLEWMVFFATLLWFLILSIS
jgi:hypothetical membrane protein